MKFLGLHIRNTANVGDRWSCPLDYADVLGLGLSAEDQVVVEDMRIAVRDYGDYNPDVVIYGGGSLIPSEHLRRWPNALMIAWGIGFTERERPWDAKVVDAHRLVQGLFDHYGSRDAVGCDFVPCASCMNPAFQRPPVEPVRDVVYYSAARRVDVSGWGDTDRIINGPHMTNEDTLDIGEVLNFLASGKTVVTSSYHGAYWARLLGREVQIVSWGSKFHYMPAPMSLEFARKANRRFAEKVIHAIAIHGDR